jgi:SAM-dependent methyltransferase
MDWTTHYATGAGFRWWPCEELVRWVGDRRFGSVLEAGCGNGANLWFLAEHADHVLGIDACAEATKAAAEYAQRRRGKRNVSVLREDLTRALPGLASAGQSFDLVIDCMTSQHLPWAEHEALYREYRRVLKPGGWLWLCHLDCKTVSAHGEWQGASDWAGLALFPDVGFFCLPVPTQLGDVVEAAGFPTPTVRGLSREYQDGQLAHYSIIEAEAR